MNEWTITLDVATQEQLPEEQLVQLDEQAEGVADGSVTSRGPDDPGFTLRVTLYAESLGHAVYEAMDLVAKLAVGLSSADLVGVSGETAERAAQRALRPDTPELMAATDVAELLGVSRQRVHQLAADRPDFPVTYARLGTGPIWARPAIEAFARSWPRKPGRPAVLSSIARD